MLMDYYIVAAFAMEVNIFLLVTVEVDNSDRNFLIFLEMWCILLDVHFILEEKLVWDLRRKNSSFMRQMAIS